MKTPKAAKASGSKSKSRPTAKFRGKYPHVRTHIRKALVEANEVLLYCFDKFGRITDLTGLSLGKHPSKRGKPFHVRDEKDNVVQIGTFGHCMDYIFRKAMEKLSIKNEDGKTKYGKKYKPQNLF